MWTAFLLLLNIIHFENAFAEDAFFKNIQNKPIAYQKKVLRSRTQKYLESGLDLSISETLRALYLVEESPSVFYSTLNQLLNKTSTTKSSQELALIIISDCDNYRCAENIHRIIQNQNSDFLKKFSDEMFDGKTLNKIYDPNYITQEDFKKIGTFAIEYDKKNILHILQWANNFFYLDMFDYFNKTDFGDISKEIWFEFEVCKAQFLKGLLENAIKCFSKNQNPWFVFEKYLIEIKTGAEKPNAEKMNKYVEEIEKFDHAKSTRARLSKIINLNKMDNEDKVVFANKDLCKSSPQGFSVLTLNKIFKFLDKNEEINCQEIFEKNNSQYFIYKVYVGEKNSSELEKMFGKFSPLVQLNDFVANKDNK